jgi:virginiamycin B lyase
MQDPTGGASAPSYAIGGDSFIVSFLAKPCQYSASADKCFTEFQIPTAGSQPVKITAGADGALWFTESLSNKIGRIPTSATPSNPQITEFPLSNGAYPNSLVLGPDGALWFTETLGDKIGRIPASATASNPQIKEFQLSINSFPNGIAAGSDGALWFVESGSNKIGRITVSGAITEFSIPTPDSNTREITLGPDGALWFIEVDSNKIGRIPISATPSNPQITEVPIAYPAGVDITGGPDGALWFTTPYNRTVSRIPTSATPSNPQVTPFSVSSSPFGIAFLRYKTSHTHLGPEQLCRFAHRDFAIIALNTLEPERCPSFNIWVGWKMRYRT